MLPTGPHAVRRIPWTSRDPPLESPQTQAHMLSKGSLGHPGILPWCPLRHRPPCCPEYPLVSPLTEAPMLSGGSLGHPGILPWSPLRHRPPCRPEDPLDIPEPQACQPLQFKTLETRWSKHCMLHRLGGCGPNGIIYRIILSS